MGKTVLAADDERRFREWYRIVARREGLDPDPDASGYDYRAAFKAKVRPGGPWPEEFRGGSIVPWSDYVGNDTMNTREREVWNYLNEISNRQAPRVRVGSEEVGYENEDGTTTQIYGRYRAYPRYPTKGNIELHGGRIEGAKDAFDSSAVAAHELGHWVDKEIESRITAPSGERGKYLEEYRSDPLLGPDEELRGDNYGYVLSRLARKEPVDSAFSRSLKYINDLMDTWKEGR